MVSPKLGILAEARLETVAQWALCEPSPKRIHLAWARPPFAQNTDPSPGREREQRTPGFLRELAWASHSRLSETMHRSKQEPSAWASCSSRTWVNLSYSRLGETSSLGREWQYSPLLHTCSKNTYSIVTYQNANRPVHTIQNIIQA